MSFLSNQENNPEFLINYLKFQAYITFKSDLTVEEMYTDIRTFFRYLIYSNYQENKNFDIDEFKSIDISNITLSDVDEVTSLKIDDFIYFLRYKLNNCAKTRNRKLSSIKKLFAYLYNQNLISSNPTKSVARAKIEKRQPKYLNLTDSKKLLSNVAKKENNNSIRDYTIICIFLNCCIRLNELVLINLTDIKLDERTLRIHGKGKLERIIYLNDAVLEAITKYLNVRPKLNDYYPDKNALFLSNRKKRISRRTVQKIIKDELNTSIDNSDNRYHTHSLRHTGATLMYNENNTDILIIKEILGHKSICSTEIYTHVADKRLKELAMNFNILDIGGNKNE